MGYEFELKFRGTERSQQALLADGTIAWQTIHMETTYYDTPTGALSARRCTLRTRLENGECVCTLKTPAGAGRGEWECRCADIIQALPELERLGAPGAILELTREGLESVCGARFTRRAGQIELDGAVLELALDKGILFAGSRQTPLCEIEVELKAGSEEAALAYGRSLAQRFDLVAEPKSKFRRAFELREED